MSDPPAVVCIGKGCIDQITSDRGSIMFPGGAALNVAVGLSRLGVAAALLADIGWDQRGQWLRSFLRLEGVDVLPHPTVNFTDLVVADREDGHATYRLGSRTTVRQIRFGPRVTELIAGVKAVVVSSYALGDSHQTDGLLAVLSQARGFCAIDPNPRPGLIFERESFVRNLERVAPFAGLVKVSAQDARVLYGEAVEHVASHLLDLGVKAVFVTRGADGASIHTATGWTANVGVPNLAGAVTDTIGAGDASLAAIVSRIVGSGSPQSLSDWVRYMRFAMLVAAMTCRVVGGLAAVPSDGGDINGEADGATEGVTGHDASR